MSLDVNILRIAVTVAGLVLFLLLIVHSYSNKRKPEHDQAAMLPFLDEQKQENHRE